MIANWNQSLYFKDLGIFPNKMLVTTVREKAESFWKHERWLWGSQERGGALRPGPGWAQVLFKMVSGLPAPFSGRLCVPSGALRGLEDVTAWREWESPGLCPVLVIHPLLSSAAPPWFPACSWRAESGSPPLLSRTCFQFTDLCIPLCCLVTFDSRYLIFQFWNLHLVVLIVSFFFFLLRFSLVFHCTMFSLCLCAYLLKPL